MKEMRNNEKKRIKPYERTYHCSGDDSYFCHRPLSFNVNIQHDEVQRIKEEEWSRSQKNFIQSIIVGVAIHPEAHSFIHMETTATCRRCFCTGWRKSTPKWNNLARSPTYYCQTHFESVGNNCEKQSLVMPSVHPNFLEAQKMQESLTSSGSFFF